MAYIFSTFFLHISLPYIAIFMRGGSHRLAATPVGCSSPMRVGKYDTNIASWAAVEV